MTYWHFRLALYVGALVFFVVGAITGIGHPRSWGVIFLILVLAIPVLVFTRPKRKKMPMRRRSDAVRLLADEVWHDGDKKTAEQIHDAARRLEATRRPPGK